MFPRTVNLDKNEIIIDEKRRIAVNERNLTEFQSHIYKRNYFKNYRPDLNSLDYYIWQLKWRIGEEYLNELNRAFNREVSRTYLQTPLGDLPKKMRVFL